MPAGVPWKAQHTACWFVLHPHLLAVASWLRWVRAPRCNGRGCRVIQSVVGVPCCAPCVPVCVHVHLPECGCWWSCRQRVLGSVACGWFHGWCLAGVWQWCAADRQLGFQVSSCGQWKAEYVCQQEQGRCCFGGATRSYKVASPVQILGFNEAVQRRVSCRRVIHLHFISVVLTSVSYRDIGSKTYPGHASGYTAYLVRCLSPGPPSHALVIITFKALTTPYYSPYYAAQIPNSESSMALSLSSRHAAPTAAVSRRPCSRPRVVVVRAGLGDAFNFVVRLLFPTCAG
jgi:hypothetical protein